MTEMIPTTIVFGGNIARADVERLNEELLEGGDTIESAAAAGACVTTSGDSNYGTAEDLCDLLRELGLTYRRTSDAKYEYDGDGVLCRPAKGVLPDGEDYSETPFGCTQDGMAYVTHSDLKIALDAGRSLADVVKGLDDLMQAIPPIVIEEGDDA